MNDRCAPCAVARRSHDTAQERLGGDHVKLLGVIARRGLDEQPRQADCAPCRPEAE
jgi:hypothetical protein